MKQKTPLCKMLALSAFFCLVAFSLAYPGPTRHGASLGPGGRIVGGHGAYIQDFPYMASLRSIIADVAEDQLCGASIISEEWLLTSASCSSQFEVKELMVRVGESNSGEGKAYTVSKVIIHANYSGGSSLKNDISLLKVKPPLVFNSTVKAVKLAAANSSLPAGTNVTLAGWGTVETGGLPLDYLRQMTMPVLTWTKCSQDYPSSSLDEDTMFCAGYDEAGKGPCQYDEGGPLVSDAGAVQVGLLSWGVQCAAANRPGVYTRISHYRDWISAHTGV